MVLNSESKQQEFKIVVFGFDKLGFEFPSSDLKLRDVYNVEYIKFEDFKNFDNVDGVIIPQGIFEEFTIQQDILDIYTKIQVRENLLLEVERHVNNLIEMGKWVCFLVSSIMDEVPAGNYRTNKVDNTDLCKRILNKFKIDRKLIPGAADVEAKSAEFVTYIENYGVAKTVFLPGDNGDYNARGLAYINNNMVGIEIENYLFFLPFHTTKSSSEDLNGLITILMNSILDYRKKRILEIPSWVNDFGFRNEKRILGKINNFEVQLKEHYEQLRVWQRYKTILLASGDILKDIVVEILREFFNLKVDAANDLEEDAAIIDDVGLILALIVVTGTEQGIKREHINQVDSHREKNNLFNNVPGILIINDQMEVKGIDDKLRSTVASEQIRHAKNMNVLIVRTIDLLILMRQLEGNDQRGEVFLDIMKSGGGFLKLYEDED